MDWRHDVGIVRMKSSHSKAAWDVPFDLSARLLNFVHSNWAQPLQQFVYSIPIEMRIRRFDADEKSIPACQSKSGFIEQRMVRHRQPVECQHAQRCEECGEQD